MVASNDVSSSFQEIILTITPSYSVVSQCLFKNKYQNFCFNLGAHRWQLTQMKNGLDMLVDHMTRSHQFSTAVKKVIVIPGSIVLRKVLPGEVVKYWSSQGLVRYHLEYCIQLCFPILER